MTSFLSLHILADGCNQTDIIRAGHFLAACDCEYYNITTASRYDEAEKLIRLLRYQAPKARPIWRGWDKDILNDGSIWQRTRPQEWVNYRITPNAKWLKELDVIVLPCNEVGVLGAEARVWSEWEADCARLSHIQFEISLALLRLSTGNPLETEHDNYNAQLQAAAEFDGILTPNEYTSTRMEITNKWHVGRYRWMWEQQDKLKIKRSPIVIGEYGIAQVNPDNSLDPYHGYGDLGVNTNEHLSIIKRDGLTYQPDGVTVCWFVHGHWQNAKGSFDVQNNESLLTAVELEAKAGTLNLQPTPPTLPVSKRDIIFGEKYRVRKSGDVIRAYLLPHIDAALNYQSIPDNAIVTVLGKETTNGETWLKITYTNITGVRYIQSDLIDIRQTTTMPVVVAPPEPLPDAPQAPPSDLPDDKAISIHKPPETPLETKKGYVPNAVQIATLESWRAELSVSIAVANDRIAIIDSLLASIKV
jgi:hypothetical protein